MEVDLKKIKREAKEMLEKNPEHYNAFMLYGMAKMLEFMEHHVPKEKNDKDDYKNMM